MTECALKGMDVGGCLSRFLPDWLMKDRIPSAISTLVSSGLLPEQLYNTSRVVIENTVHIRLDSIATASMALCI
jgi:hypothetical protein